MGAPLPPYAASIQSPFPILAKKDDFRRQGFEVPNTRREGSTGIYRSSRFPYLSIHDSPRFPKTTYDIFNHGLSRSPDRPCLGHRPIDPKTGDFEPRFVWQTYREVDRRRTTFGSGLVKLQRDGVLGTEETKGWRVGLWMHNRPEWQIVAQACGAYSLVSLALYDTLGKDTVEYCTNHSEARVIVASSAHIPTLLSLASKCPSVKVIVSAETWAEIDGVKNMSIAAVPPSEVFKKWGAERGVKVMDFAEVEALGEANLIPHVFPRHDEIASFIYTSGTTGKPKAAILLHSNMAASTTGNLHGERFSPDDVMLSYLPLAHIYERFCEDVCLAVGMPIGYSCGDNLRLIEDLQLLKPTRIASVPRVLNRIYQAVNAQMDVPGLKGKLAQRALASKMQNLKESGAITHALWDWLVFKKVKQALGGRVTLIGSGSAPISPDVVDFLRIAFITEVTEGYGSTENTTMVTKCLQGDHDTRGTVGPPQAGVEIKLVDVPDMNYFSTDKPYPRGEICIRGEACIPGYYKDEAKTKELIDSEGWQHSGDIGLIDEKGRLKIIDRIKNLLKLAQGEYVAVEKVEGIYSICPLVAQIYIHGDSLEAHLIAIVVPNPEPFAVFASKITGNQITPTHVEGLVAACQDPKVIKAFLAEMDKESRKARLNGFEMARQLHLTMEPFTAENDLLTPTLKLKRLVAQKKFKAVTDKLYAEARAAAPKAKL